MGSGSGSPSAGTVTIDSGSATFTSTTIGGNVNGGTLAVNGGTVSLGAVNDKRDASVGTATLTSGLVIAGGTVTASSVNISSANSGGDLTLSSGSLTIGNSSTTGGFQVGTGTSPTRGGFLTVSGGTLTYAGTDGLLVNNAISCQGTAALSGGISTLTGITLNKTGNTNGSATLTISGTAAVYLGSVGLAENSGTATATINLTGGTLGAAADWSSSVPLTLGGVTLKTADASSVAHNITLNGVLSGTPFIKTGNGTLTLGASAGNTYTGATTISAGTLLVNNTTGSGTSSGAVTVTNATLGGTGTISGATTLQTNAVLAPGVGGIGTLSFGGALTLSPASTNSFVVTTAGGASNKVAVAGVLTPSNSVVKVTSGTALGHGLYTLFTYGSISGSFNPTVVYDVAPAEPASLVNDGTNHVNLVVNAPPVAGTNFTMGVVNGIPATVQIVGGKYAPTDADGDALTITGVTGYTNATVTFDGTNVTYTATNGTADSFTYTVSDGFGGTASQTVNVVISTAGPGFNLLSGPVDNGNGTMTINYLGVPGYNYALDTTTNLTAPVTWTPVNTNMADTNGALGIIFTNSQGQGFFRTRYVP